MKKEYDFSNARRGAVIEPKGKTRITIWLDDAILESFRAHSMEEGRGYQTLINETLKSAVCKNADSAPVTLQAIRRVLREELLAAQVLHPPCG